MKLGSYKKMMAIVGLVSIIACFAGLVPAQAQDEDEEYTMDEKKIAQEFAQDKAIISSAGAGTLSFYSRDEKGQYGWKLIRQFDRKEMGNIMAEIAGARIDSYGRTKCPFWIKMEFPLKSGLQKVYIGVDSCRQFYFNKGEGQGKFKSRGAFGRIFKEFLFEQALAYHTKTLPGQAEKQLVQAIKTGDYPAVSNLLNQKPALVRVGNGIPLLLAVEMAGIQGQQNNKTRLDILKLLLDKGAPPNARLFRSVYTPLWLALENDDYRSAALLRSKGARLTFSQEQEFIKRKLREKKEKQTVQ